MAQSDPQSYKPSLLALTFPGLLCFAVVWVFTSKIVGYLMPYGNAAGAVGVVTGFFVCRQVLDRYHPVITIIAVLFLADAARVEWFPSEKSCRSMERKENYLLEQQAKATDYWQSCIAPNSDQQEYCTDFKPERTIESLAEEWEYVSDRRFNRCNR